MVCTVFLPVYLCAPSLAFPSAHCTCILVYSSTGICWTSPFVILGVSSLFCRFYFFVILGVSGLFCRFYFTLIKKILIANTVDPDQTPHYVASDLGLHCWPVTLLLLHYL